MPKLQIRIIGAGLAGCEAAFFLANRGIQVKLHEMRPLKQTEAHQTDSLAELVCSNSFKSLSPITAPGILKSEMMALGSLAMDCSKIAAIGAGEALAVDRDVFSREMTKKIQNHPNIQLIREEIQSLPDSSEEITILATGPLTSESLSKSLIKYTSSDHFYFYDAISPIVDAQSLDMNIIFAANRYGKKTRSIENQSADTNEDYLNCPFSKEQYYEFIHEILRGERVQPKSFERIKHFEGCMPIEEMADRGIETLRFGPMKPVGLDDPRTGREPYAAVQLRAENVSRTAFNLVGFQTKLKYGEQQRIFRKIPGMENVEFLRMGSMHRNTFVDSPRVLNLDLSLKSARHILLAGQITGVEGYMESASIGILAGIFSLAKIQQKPIPVPPKASAMGSLLSHLSNTLNPDFQPSGINFGLFDDLAFQEDLAPLRQKYSKKLPKEEKRRVLGEASLKNMAPYAGRIGELFPRFPT
jgi:methylenetetrahydrofolate--tRNA-(uracil-5-)-methyltransferase